MERLSRKDLRHALHRLRLVGLYGKFEFHLGHYSTFLCVFGLYVPAVYLAYGAVLYLAFGFGLFERSVDGALYIFGFVLSFGCSAVIAFRRLRTKPLKDLLRVAAEEYAGKRRSKNAPEVPRIYRSRVNRGVTVYEYADRYDLYEKRGRGLAIVKTVWKKDKR